MSIAGRDFARTAGARRDAGTVGARAQTCARVLATVLIALAAASAVAQADARATEERIVQYVDEGNPGALALLARVVNINSGTMNSEGVRAVGKVFAAEFESLGFATEWIEGAAFERAGHLVARRAGGSRHVLLIGHLDTVFEPDSPFQRFERIPGDSARGPGISDMKGGDVVVVAALRALERAGVLDDLTVTVVFTGDEERPGRPLSTGRRVLRDAADAADVAIAFENGDNNPGTAVTSRRGATRWTLRVGGTPAHSSQVFREDIGAGAVYEAARILHRFYTELAGEPLLTFNPGLILGGTDVHYDSLHARGDAFGKNNVIAAHAVVTGDLRTIAPEQLALAKERMTAIVSENWPGTTAQIEFDDGYPPMAPTEGNARLLAMLDGVSRDLGFGPVTALDPARAGAADVAFTAGRVEMALDGLGLLGDGEHTLGEKGNLASLPMQSKRTAVLLYRLSRPGGTLR